MQRALDWIAKGHRGLWLALAIFALCLALGWVGFIASDDATYVVGAYGWLEQFPFVGGHGTIRYPLTIPIALSFLVFGEGEVAAILPSLAYLLVFLFFTWRVLCGVAGRLAAFVALLLVVTCPLIAVEASIASIDIPEMTLLMGGLFVLWRCLETGPDARRLFLVGALVGVAFLARETAIFSVPFFALLFLAGHRFSRWHYLWIAAGFLAVWSLELVYLGIMTGDPLYRFNIALHHDATIDRTIDLAGNVLVHPLIDPVLVLFINQEFMALMLFAVPVTAWLCFGASIEPRLRHFARIMALFGLCWWICVGAVQNLLPLNPRYFMVTSTIACLLTGIGVARLLGSQTQRLRLIGLGALAILLATNALGILVENKNPIFGERQLVQVLSDRPGLTVHTDPMTLYRAEYLLRWSGTTARAAAEPPRGGDFYYYNPARSAEANAHMTAAQQPDYQPQAGWQLVATYEPEPDAMVRLLMMTGADAAIPEPIWQKLRYRHEPTHLYRVGAEPARD